MIISSIGISDQTTAQRDGYFEFKDQAISLVPKSEPCIYARDSLGRTTNSVCIPPIPVGKYLKIGPILLPPTISLNKANYFKGDDVVLSGQSVPNSQINLSMFVNKKTFIPTSYAYSIPEVLAATDDKGNYSITIPSSRAESYKVFSQFKKDNDISPNSNSLNLKILPYWMFILIFLKYLYSAFINNLLEIVIVSQIIAITVFISRKRLKPHRIMAQRAIVLREKYPIILLK